MDVLKLKSTGVFFHYQQGERLRDFPSPRLTGILDKGNISYYDARYNLTDGLYHLMPISEELLQEVHTSEMIERVKRSGAYEGAIYSAGGTLQAGELILSEQITNAFVFTGYGDHHAGKNFFGGGCYFNSAALSIANLRKKRLAKRFAIVDTDAHHGDGSWDIFKDNPDTLYVCLCGQQPREQNNNVNIFVPCHVSDEEYLAIVGREFVPRVNSHKPELIFWNFGYDGTHGDYGDIGLTPDCHSQLARNFQNVADRVCQGRLITILCGGSQRRLASYIIPKVIVTLAKLNQ